MRLVVRLVLAAAALVGGPTARATTYDFSPRGVLLLTDGARLVAQDGWDSAALYRVADGGLVHRFPARGRVRKIVASPDERELLVATDGALTLWRVETGERVWERTSAETGLRYVGDVGFAGDGGRLAVCDRDDRVLVFDARTGGRVGEVAFPPGRTNVVSVALNADGTGGFLVPLGGGLHRFTVAAGRPVDARLSARGPVRFSADFKHLAFPVGREPGAEQLAVISTDAEPVKRSLGTFDHIGVIRPLPDGSFLVTASVGRWADQTYSGTRIWPDGRVEELWKLGGGAGGVCERTAFLPSPLIGVSTTARLVTTVIDLRTNRTVLEIDNSANARLEMASTFSRGWGCAEWFVVATVGLGAFVTIRVWRARRGGPT